MKDIYEGLEDIVPSDAEIRKETWRANISNTLRGKTLEEIVGVEAAERGRAVRAKNSSGPRNPAIGQKIAATRRANDSYGKSMLGKEHKESTKEIMSQKAKVRQDLKRELGLGRNESIPKDILLAEYNKRGLL